MSKNQIWGGQDVPREKDTFFYIGRKLKVHSDFVNSEVHFREYAENGNFFKTEEDAQKVLDKISKHFTPLKENA